MVRQCQLCKKLDYFNRDLSFYRFPANKERGNIWFALLGFEENKVLPKYADICSSHFNESDFQYKANGIKYLKADANPKFINPEIFLAHTSVRHLWNLTWKKLRQQIIECYVLFRFSISSTSSEHSDSEFSIASILKDGPDSKRLTELPLNDKIVPEEQVQYCIPKTESSTTLTASEAEHLLEENVSGEQQACHSKSEIKRNLATLRPVRCASWP